MRILQHSLLIGPGNRNLVGNLTPYSLLGFKRPQGKLGLNKKGLSQRIVLFNWSE